MAFKDVSRESLELLNQNYRSPDVQSLSYPPSRGLSTAAQDPSYRVVDDFLKILITI